MAGNRELHYCLGTTPSDGLLTFRRLLRVLINRGPWSALKKDASRFCPRKKTRINRNKRDGWLSVHAIGIRVLVSIQDQAQPRSNGGKTPSLKKVTEHPTPGTLANDTVLWKQA